MVWFRNHFWIFMIAIISTTSITATVMFRSAFTSTNGISSFVKNCVAIPVHPRVVVTPSNCLQNSNNYATISFIPQKSEDVDGSKFKKYYGDEFLWSNKYFFNNDIALVVFPSPITNFKEVSIKEPVAGTNLSVKCFEKKRSMYVSNIKEYYLISKEIHFVFPNRMPCGIYSKDGDIIGFHAKKEGSHFIFISQYASWIAKHLQNLKSHNLSSTRGKRSPLKRISAESDDPKKFSRVKRFKNVYERVGNHEYPYVLKIRSIATRSSFKSDNQCTATIISPNLLLSAAHCFIMFPSDVVLIQKRPITFNEIDFDNYGVALKVHIFPQYNYTDSKAMNDIALIQMPNYVNFEQPIVSIANDMKNVTSFTALGFGCVTEPCNQEEDFPTHLVKIVNEVEKLGFVQITSKRTSALALGGDSGGPLLNKNQLIGVLHGHHPGDNKNVGTLIHEDVKRWIRTFIRDQNAGTAIYKPTTDSAAPYQKNKAFHKNDDATLHNEAREELKFR